MVKIVSIFELKYCNGCSENYPYSRSFLLFAGHDEHNVVYYGVDNLNGDLALIREYELKPVEKLINFTLDQVRSIENELKYLKRLKDSNIIAYLDLKHVVMEKGQVLVYVLQEFGSDVTLATYKNWNLSIDFSFIRFVVQGLLRALSFLHQHNVVHRNIKTSSVYLCRSKFKLCSYFILWTKRKEHTATQQNRGGRGLEY